MLAFQAMHQLQSPMDRVRRSELHLSNLTNLTNLSNERAFTLIEIMIVIAIIAATLAIAAPGFSILPLKNALWS